MSGLNLPSADLHIRKQGEKDYVFDRLRKQYVRLTPEEFVRQHFIHYLIVYKGYPEGLLANEVSIELGNVNRRCDTVLYDKHLQAQMIIEYKAPVIAINQTIFDQIARYNMSLQVPWLIVSNGLQHFCCHIDKEKGEYTFLKDIPPYDELRTKN
ncbi:MAG: type I restriction enzyme HsdR N-terminal domain-containing protein [Candidatus Symbiothrix sp.]|jgi:predicted type IV restriction endonuclease|nr:type I restriction enzyme HsdR N-terminal domain-containing protein [Candidatus Symbiothrix sp.]